MSDNKKYYYIRIKENFFETEDMKLLQAMENGYLFSDILMKLYLASLKNDGKLMFKEHIPYSPKMIATITNHNIAIVEQALTRFTQLGLIEVLDNGAIFMVDIESLIGKSSSEGDRKREYRKRIDDEKQKLLIGGQMSDKRPPETETETEIKTETELQQHIKKVVNCELDEATVIINNVRKFHSSKNVIDVVVDKVNVVSSGKYENYIGALITAIRYDWKKHNNKKNNDNFNNYEQRVYDFDELEKKLLGWD